MSETSKHAYCIIAHDDQFCLQALLKGIDDSSNDIFLLIDKKSHTIDEKKLKVEKSNLYIIPEEIRIDIRWGGLSMVKAELLLFSYALKKGNYTFLHLLSGADLPLQPPRVIKKYFESLPKGSNVINFSEGENIRKNVEFKTRYYHPFVENQKFRRDSNNWHFLQDATAKFIRKGSVFIQKLLHVRRNWKDLKIKKGSQWISISNEFAHYLIKNSDFILNRFKGVICADEIFVHTMIFNSPFKETIIDPSKNTDPSDRYIDWQRGTPYTWRNSDYNELIESKCLFARKFSSKTDKEIILKIIKYVQQNKSF